MPSLLIVLSTIPCARALAKKFHALAVYLHPTFTAPFQSEVNLESIRTSAMELFVEIVDVFSLLAICAEELHPGCLAGF